MSCAAFRAEIQYDNGGGLARAARVTVGIGVKAKPTILPVDKANSDGHARGNLIADDDPALLHPGPIWFEALH